MNYIKNSLITLSIASTIAVTPLANANSFNSALIGIIYKIYQAAAAKAEQADASSTQSVPVETQNTASEAYNQPVESISHSSSSKDFNFQTATPEELQKHMEAVRAQNQANYTKSIQDQENTKASEHDLYLEEFSKRKLSAKKFFQYYYERPYAFKRNNVTLQNATAQEKIDVEKYLQYQAEHAEFSKKYHTAFQKHVQYVIQDMSLSFQDLRSLMQEGDPHVQKEFNLNPAGDAIILKVLWSGVLKYEKAHPEMNTQCAWGIGGRDEYLEGCDDLLNAELKEYANHNKIKSFTISKADMVKIAHQINPHETLD